MKSETEKVTWITQMNHEREYLQSKASQLQALANAFYITGNNTLSTRLGEMADDILQSVKNIDTIVDKKIHDDFKQAEQSSVNIICAAVAATKQGDG